MYILRTSGYVFTIPDCLADAAIVISEHYENMNRVVTLQRSFDYTKPHKGVGWLVQDGGMFKGYDPQRLPERVFVQYETLAIEQWKLRLLDDGEPVVIRDEREYVES